MERQGVARNIEIKARVSDMAALRSRVATVARTSSVLLRQTDTFFIVPQGRLKLREFEDGSGELICYERSDQAGPKESSYLRDECPEPKAMLEVLGRALGVRGIVEKRREVFLLGRTRIHLDEVRGLGSFLEIEVVLDDGEAPEEGVRVARELLATLQVQDSTLVEGAYIDLIEGSEPIP